MFILFSGFDSHEDDCGENYTNWDYNDIEEITKIVIDKTIELDIPLASVNGGGYKFDVSVKSYVSHINVMNTYRI